MRQPKERFALCLDNADYEVSLIPGKVYLIIPDERRRGHSVTSKTMKIDAQASHAGRDFRTRAQQDGLIRMGVGLELSDSRGLVKSYDTFDVGRCQTVRRRAVGMPGIGV